MQLLIRSNNASNPLALDLTNYIDVQAGSGMDPASPSFTDKVFARSLLKEGATLSLEQMTEKELAFPLKLNAPLAGYTNAAANPSFEYDTAGQAPAVWSASGTPSALLVQNGWAASGAQSLRYTETRNDGPGSHFVQQSSPYLVPVAPGQVWSLGAEVNVLTLGSGCGVRLRITWLQADGSTVISSVLGAEVLTTGVAALTLLAQTAPALAAFAQISLAGVFGSGTVTIDTYLDAVQFVEAATLPAYIDGDSFGCVWNGPSGYSSSTAPGGSSRTARMVQQLNQVVTSPGATASWQDDGTSQPTVFDLLSGQFDLAYNYREGQQAWCSGKLRLFSQPLGHTGAPRPYAAASGYGPLLMISPYASSGAFAVGPSTQAGVSGWGGAPGGASTGVFYEGSPQLAGDAPALLQMSYTGPLPNGASNAGVVPYVAVSVLPDATYQPLFTASQMTGVASSANAHIVNQAGAVAGAYWHFEPNTVAVTIDPLGHVTPPESWAGLHRMFAIARASMNPAVLEMPTSVLTPKTTTATVYPGDWGLYDLGVFTIRASEPQIQPLYVTAWAPGPGAFEAPNVGSAALDVTAFVMLPDSNTWFVNPVAVSPSQYGAPSAIGAAVGVPAAQYTNTLLFDGVLGDQFLYAGASQHSAPSIAGGVANSARITQYSRGLVPRPDPRSGPPTIAILGVGQHYTPSQTWIETFTTFPITIPGGSWANPQNLLTSAQLNVLERTRYVLP